MKSNKCRSEEAWCLTQSLRSPIRVNLLDDWFTIKHLIWSMTLELTLKRLCGREYIVQLYLRGRWDELARQRRRKLGKNKDCFFVCLFFFPHSRIFHMKKQTFFFSLLVKVVKEFIHQHVAALIAFSPKCLYTRSDLRMKPCNRLLCLTGLVFIMQGQSSQKRLLQDYNTAKQCSSNVGGDVEAKTDRNERHLRRVSNERDGARLNRICLWICNLDKGKHARPSAWCETGTSPNHCCVFMWARCKHALVKQEHLMCCLCCSFLGIRSCCVHVDS